MCCALHSTLVFKVTLAAWHSSVTSFVSSLSVGRQMSPGDLSVHNISCVQHNNTLLMEYKSVVNARLSVNTREMLF